MGRIITPTAGDIITRTALRDAEDIHIGATPLDGAPSRSWIRKTSPIVPSVPKSLSIAFLHMIHMTLLHVDDTYAI